jgi:hypothetical protein
MTKLPFTEDEIWNGGFYELAIEVGAVLHAIWTHPTLEGCYLDPNTEPHEQQRITSTQALLESGAHLRGLALLPNGQQVACGTCLIRESEVPTG